MCRSPFRLDMGGGGPYASTPIDGPVTTSEPTMPELLLELFSEEIPARMQRKASEDLKKMITDGLVAAGIGY